MSYHLKLIKGLSYFGFGGKVNVTAAQPDIYIDDKATAEQAVASGYFQLFEEVEESPEPEEQPGKTLDEMTVPELETYAAYKGVSLKGISGKKNIIAKLKEELGEEETENEVDYGSPTMTELQEQQ